MNRKLKRFTTAFVSTTLIASAWGAAAAVPAAAKPPTKIGPVVGLSLTVSKPGDAYAVTASWNPLSGATKYVVDASSGGTAIGSATVTTPTWTGSTTQPAGTTVRVTVTPFQGKRPGIASSVSTVLPDLTAPVASYSVIRKNGTGGDVALHLDSLTDDVTSPAQITQSVAWDDGQPAVSWAKPFADLAHRYSEDKAVHHVTVTATDQAGNSRSSVLTVVVNDTTAPTGAYTTSGSSAWAGWTTVELLQTAVSDDLSVADKITRTVSWGDGTAPQVWPHGSPLTHRFAQAGTFTPTVSLTDEAGNTSAPVATAPVTVSVDSVRPTVRLTLPKTKRSYVGSWKRLKGVATDAQTGVRHVEVRIVEKRDTTWYAYRPATRTWVKGGSTKVAAMKKARVAIRTTTTANAWSMPVSHLTKGVLFYKASSVDNVSNRSASKSHKQVLSQR